MNQPEVVAEQPPVQEVGAKIDALVEALAKLKTQLSEPALTPSFDVKAAVLEFLNLKDAQVMEAVKELVQDAVDGIDFDDKVDTAVNEYDWDSTVEGQVEDAVNKIDFDDKVRDALSNITLHVQF